MQVFGFFLEGVDLFGQMSILPRQPGLLGLVFHVQLVCMFVDLIRDCNDIVECLVGVQLASLNSGAETRDEKCLSLDVVLGAGGWGRCRAFRSHLDKRITKL